ncbi:iduronate 2-sulfatase isoform X2 [Harmonia axyridis]|uniref:iduronate 2-sulfatase isoform X2 n=1 Tax=Harmonia axyridis TaxID=115357 RepID=UPI001E276E81|nr:iduronate 2-sulfatase isoform X2 [Harmonia axyridis]
MNLLLIFAITQLFEFIFCKPNVLFIIVDDLRPNLGCYDYGNAVTPNIDKLSSKSFLFYNAFCQQSLCAPSRNSFLTSRRPDSVQLYDLNSYYWREKSGNFTTLPQHFKENGYYTYAIGKVFHPSLTSNSSDDMPYSWSKKPFHPKTEIYKNANVCVNSNGMLSKNLLCPVRVFDQPGGTLPDLESLRSVLDFLKFQKNYVKDRPYFLAVGFHKPHIPYKFPEQFLNFHPIFKVNLPSNRRRPYSLPNVAWNPWIDIRNREDVKKLNISIPFGNMPDHYSRRIIQHYNAAVTYIDDLIGNILKAVEGTDTITVLTSDHEHGEYSKYSNFDVSTRVPLIIHAPNLSSTGVIIEKLVELVDLFPTLVDLTRVSPSLTTCSNEDKSEKLCTEGRSLVPIMEKALQKKPVDGKKAVFSQYPRPGDFPSVIPNSDEPEMADIKIMGYSVRTKTHRFTQWVEFNITNFKPNWLKIYGTELYDHTIDLHENMNLIDRKELSSVAKNLRKILISGWRYA